MVPWIRFIICTDVNAAWILKRYKTYHIFILKMKNIRNKKLNIKIFLIIIQYILIRYISVTCIELFYIHINHINEKDYYNIIIAKIFMNKFLYVIYIYNKVFVNWRCYLGPKSFVNNKKRVIKKVYEIARTNLYLLVK